MLSILTLALLASTLAASPESVDPCKRQPFRGRCPGVNGGPQTRSQFVLRYYVRDGECVSYPFGHCSRDENEPKLYRYKEECEDACLRQKATPAEVEGTKKTELATSTPSSFSVPLAENKTECEKQKEFGEQNGGFIPQCTPEGEFQSIQCETEHRKCFCVDPKGVEIAFSRTDSKKKPDCASILKAQQPTINECSVPPEQGPCTSTISRWYYDEKEKVCKHFRYSGCGGNGNNYASKASCEKRCAPPVTVIRCHLGKEPLRTSQGELVNCGKTACPAGYKCSVVQQSSVCCPDVEKFKEAGVLRASQDPQVCSLPKERGPCDRYELRFYYNNDLKECKYFFFGGCEGNGNNFERVEDCEKTCAQESKTSPTKILTTLRLTTSRTTKTTLTTKPPTTTTKTSVSTTLRAGKTSEAFSPATSTGASSEPEGSLLPVNRCMHPMDSGDCNGQFIRWFWNPKVKTCEAFTYTGCNGNGNNFASKEECLSNCHFEEPEVVDLTNVCEHEIDSGECKQSFQRYAYDKEANECRAFVYGGCGGNGNNFGTATECRNKCVKEEKQQDVCQLPLEVGSCSGVFTRYAFDASAKECRRFTYGGCGSNGNNFASIEECSRACVKEEPEPVVPRRPTSEDSDTSESAVTSSTPSSGIQTSSFSSTTTEQVVTATGTPTESMTPKTVEPKYGLGDKCTQPVEPGPCRNFVNRYYYNTASGDCELFKYGGCAGNKNHFFTRRECEIHCARFSNKASANVPEIEKGLPPPSETTIGPTEENDTEATATISSTGETEETEINSEVETLEIPMPATSGWTTPVPEAMIPMDATENITGQTITQAPPTLSEVNKSKTGSTSAKTILFTEKVTTPSNVGSEKSVETQDGSSPEATKPMDNGDLYSSEEEDIRNHETEEVTAEQPSEPSVVVPIRPLETTVDQSVGPASQAVGSGDICNFRADPGNCFEYVLRWFFNPETSRCEQFSYTMCGGNANNFIDRRTCESRCQPTNEPQVPARCTLPKDAGAGSGYNVRWYFNIRNLMCEQMVYYGTGGNDNQFATLESCQASCIVNALQPSDIRPSQAVAESSENQYQNENFYRHRTPAPVQPVITSAVPELQNLVPVVDTHTKDYSNVAQPTGNKATSFRELPHPAIKDDSVSSKEFSKAESDEDESRQSSVDVPGSLEIAEISQIPPCANGRQPVTQRSGRPLLCLPGKHQCPRNSECFFNGINFFCCPNAEDPYDQHVFGGYNGEEEKYGYKSIRNELNIRSLSDNMRRTRRHSASETKSSLEKLVQPVRFDGELPGHYIRATALKLQTHPCLQPVQPGPCKEAHLRHFFDKKAKACRLFYYGGCQGNANNFATELECEQKCKKGLKEEDVLPGMCPDGRLPLGGNVPVLCGNLTESIGCPIGYSCKHGPPDVCCPDETVDPIELQKILIESKKSENVRFAPSVNEQTVVKAEFMDLEEAKKSPTTFLDSFLSKICPDGSDALKDPQTGKIIRCGYGRDGEAFCPIGFYCSINHEKDWRFCCPIALSGNNIPPPPVSAPFFGQRKANPGEIIERGSLPSDLKPGSVSVSNTVNSKEESEQVLVVPSSFSNVFKGDDAQEVPERSVATAAASYSIAEGSDYGRMMMRPGSKRNHQINPDGKESDGVQIDIGSTDDPFDVSNGPVKSWPDRSVCMLESSEGRPCQEDEPLPRTNLQYAYSRKDRRCKLFFYKGCGGNDNRFETKRHCDALCLGI